MQELSQQERMTFIGPLTTEVDAVIAHLTHGTRMARAYRFGALDADPLLSCLALGMEKMAKLTIGLIFLDETGHWGGFGNSHDVADLDSRAQAALRRRLALANSRPHLERLMAEVSSDPVVTGVVSTVSNFGMKGRYFNLDSLKGPVDRVNPKDLWDDVQAVIIDKDPSLLRRLATAEAEAARRDMNELIAVSVERWWAFYARCWQAGVVGDIARQWSGTMVPKPPVGSPRPW